MIPLTDVRALTLHEPFASFMLGPVGIRCKSIETRGYPCPPGVSRLLITAAAVTTHRVIHGEVIGDYVTLRGAHGEGDEIVHQETGQCHRITYGAALGIVTVDASLPMVRWSTLRTEDHVGEQFLAVGPSPGDIARGYHDHRAAIIDKREPLHDRHEVTDLAYGLFERGRFGWMTSNARRLITPVPCRGLQRVWRPTPALLERIAAQLR